MIFMVRTGWLCNGNKYILSTDPTRCKNVYYKSVKYMVQTLLGDNIQGITDFLLDFWIMVLLIILIILYIP